jgi:hypothetical protein
VSHLLPVQPFEPRATAARRLAPPGRDRILAAPRGCHQRRQTARRLRAPRTEPRPFAINCAKALPRARTLPLLAAAGRAHAAPALGLVCARCARAPPLCASPHRPPATLPAPFTLLRFSRSMRNTTHEARRKRQLLAEQQHEAAQQIAASQCATRGSRGLRGRCGASARHVTVRFPG